MTSGRKRRSNRRKPIIRSLGFVNTMGTPKTENPKTADSPPDRKGAKTSFHIRSGGPLPFYSGSKTWFHIRPGDPFAPGTKTYEELLAYSRTLREWSRDSYFYFDKDPSVPGTQLLENYAAYCDKIQRSDIATSIRKRLSQAGCWIKPKYSPVATPDACAGAKRRTCRKRKKHLILDPPGHPRFSGV